MRVVDEDSTWGEFLLGCHISECISILFVAEPT
jgi:hypothetical protein